jgi:drug/metabolite transporter (DMT)-like permease
MPLPLGNLSPATLGELAALGTAVAWTFSSVFSTSAGRRLGALPVSFTRMVVGAALMMFYGRLLGGGWLPTDAPSQVWLLLSVSGFLGFFLCDVCLVKGMLLIGPRLALLIYSLTPPMAAVFSFVIGDALGLRQWAAMGVTLAGVAWVLVERPNGEHTAHSRRERRKGIYLSIFATAASAAGIVISRKVMGQYNYNDAVGATLIRALASLPGYVVLVTLWRRWPAMLAAVRPSAATPPLLAASVLGPFVGNALIMAALARAPAGVVTTITATMPVMILPLSVLIYREKFGPRGVFGAVLATAGVALLML